MKYFIISITLIISAGTNLLAQTKYTGEKGKVQIHLKREIVLKEDKILIGRISDFTVASDKSIYALDSQQGVIIKFDKNGNQPETFGKKGRGPYEFLGPSSILIDGDTLSIWDKKQLKFIALTTEGKPLLELTDFTKSVSYIKKYKNYLITYNSGGFIDSVIDIYDLENKKLIIKLGDKTNEHILLMTLRGSGGISVANNRILYSRADELVLREVNLKTFQETNYPIHIPGFNVDKLTTTAHQIVNNNRKEMTDYLATNSRITNIFSLNDYVIVEAHTGHLLTNEDNPFGKRIENFAILDKSFNQLDTISFTNSSFTSSNLLSSLNNKIYVLSQKQNVNSFEYVLKVWEFNSIR